MIDGHIFVVQTIFLTIDLVAVESVSVAIAHYCLVTPPHKIYEKVTIVMIDCYIFYYIIFACAGILEL